MNRKIFFKRGGRLAILSGFGLISAILAYHHQIVTPENCSVTPLCENCSKFAQCELPQANKERRNGR